MTAWLTVPSAVLRSFNKSQMKLKTHVLRGTGDLTLSDLTINTEALDGLGLPMDFKGCHVDAIDITIPLVNIWSSSVKVVIRGITILCTEAKPRQWRDDLHSEANPMEPHNCRSPLCLP